MLLCLKCDHLKKEAAYKLKYSDQTVNVLLQIMREAKSTYDLRFIMIIIIFILQLFGSLPTTFWHTRNTEHAVSDIQRPTDS